MICCLTAPSHYLNQYWLTLKKILWYSFQGNVYLNTQENKMQVVFKIYTFQITANFPSGQRVKGDVCSSNSYTRFFSETWMNKVERYVKLHMAVKETLKNLHFVWFQASNPSHGRLLSRIGELYSKAYVVLQYMLPGAVVLLQGDEIGMKSDAQEKHSGHVNAVSGLFYLFWI